MVARMPEPGRRATDIPSGSLFNKKGANLRVDSFFIVTLQSNGKADENCIEIFVTSFTELSILLLILVQIQDE